MKIVYIGFSHNFRDPRLFYRQMRVLKEKIPDLEIYFAKDGKLFSYFEISMLSGNNLRDGEDNLWKKVKRNINHLRNCILMTKGIIDLSPEYIQASDAREIPFAMILGLLARTKLIYDSHEDYFRQSIDYNKSILSYLKACSLYVFEILFIRFFNIVFCTDEFLYKKYRSPLYGNPSVHLLRNFPLRKITRTNVVKGKEKNVLNLVYIGGINEYRGVIEVASFVNHFNQSKKGRMLKLTIYSNPHKIIKLLPGREYITHKEYLDYDKLLSELKNYDVGICLLKDIPKFRRNLPVKNFDYMASGLPIVTSNFGNLMKYAKESKSAMCIDPTSYEEFEIVIDKLFNADLREKMGKAGLNFIRSVASFDKEAESYVGFFNLSKFVR